VGLGGRWIGRLAGLSRGTGIGRFRTRLLVTGMQRSTTSKKKERSGQTEPASTTRPLLVWCEQFGGRGACLVPAHRHPGCIGRILSELKCACPCAGTMAHAVTEGPRSRTGTASLCVVVGPALVVTTSRPCNRAGGRLRVLVRPIGLRGSPGLAPRARREETKQVVMHEAVVTRQVVRAVCLEVFWKLQWLAFFYPMARRLRF
jgi:hypothetical protein